MRKAVVVYLTSLFTFVHTKRIFAKFCMAVKTEFNPGSHERNKNSFFCMMFQYFVSISMNYKSSFKTFIMPYYI